MFQRRAVALDYIALQRHAPLIGIYGHETRRWANRAQSIPGVAQVQYNQEWVEALAGIVRYIEVAAIIVGIILSAASVTIIANTIRLALY